MNGTGMKGAAAALALGLSMSLGTLQAFAQEEIVVGGLFDQSGAAATYGQAALDGASLAFDLANEEGGIKGRKLRLMQEDPGFNVGQATALLQRFANDPSVVAILGPNSESIGAPITATVNKAEIPTIVTAGAGSRANSAYGDWMFSTAAPNRASVQKIAETLKAMGKTKVAVIFSSSRPFAVAAKDDFVAAAASNGLSLALEPQAYADSDLNFSAILTKLKAADGIQAVFCSCLPNAAGPIIQQAKQTGLDVQWAGDVSLLDPTFYTLSQGQAEGTLAATPFDPGLDSDVVRTFVTSFKAKYGRDPNMYHAYAYDSAIGLIQVLNSIEGDTTREAIRKGLSQLAFTGATGNISYPDGRGQASRAGVHVVVMKDGNFVSYKP